MKSHASDEDVVIGLHASLVKDLLYIHPTIHDELKAVSRFQSIVSKRGMAFFTIALPDLCKFLERGLSSGRLEDDRPPFGGRRSRSDARPALYWAFWALIFDSDGVLLSTPNTDAIAGLRTLLLCAKKYRAECGEEKTNAALAEFVEVDRNLPRSYVDTWDSDTPKWVARRGHPLWGATEDRVDADLFGREHLPEPSAFRWDGFRDLCRMVLTSFGDLDVYSLRPKHGPGAVADNVSVKYELPHWPRKLGAIFPADWFASHDLCDRTLSDREFPSRVLCVPKTQKGPRIIAAEPTSHQFCQGAVERWLRDRIDRSHVRWSISLRDQTPSQRLALAGSLSGELATIDLSSASDRLSTRLVEYVFQSRHDVLDVLHATRTRTFEMPDGSVHVARKFACMGSACTFPVQTIVFTIISIWATLLAEGRSVSVTEIHNVSKRVRVFGDDIIVPVGAYGLVTSLLTEVGLKVNSAKSFGTGRFRESCGLDAYLGVDVTPAYFLQACNPRNPESLVGLVASSNNFHKKGYWHAAQYLLNTIEPKLRKKLRCARRDVSQPTIFSFAPSEHHLRVRFDPDEHVLKVLALTVDTRVDHVQGSWTATIYQYFSERGDKPLLDHVLRPGRTLEKELGQSGRPKSRFRLGWVLREDRYSNDLLVGSQPR